MQSRATNMTAVKPTSEKCKRGHIAEWIYDYPSGIWLCFHCRVHDINEWRNWKNEAQIKDKKRTKIADYWTRKGA